MIPNENNYFQLDVDLFKEIEDMGDQNWQVYKAALEYIKMGMYIVPLMPNGKALPYDAKGSVGGINYGSASKKREVIEKWFEPMSGKFAGWNIGIATGKEGGVFAIDVDMHNGDDGFANLKEITDEQGEIEAPMQRTPSGGGHYLFLWQDSAASSTGKLAPSIDTRGGTDIACKGHIVAFPSTIDGIKYRWEIGGPIGDIPQWVMEKLGVVWKPNPHSGRGNEGVGADDIERTVPLEQINRMIDTINPDDMSYDDWLRIGMAIKSQYPDDDGLAMWDTWSQRGERYKAGECNKRWKGFSDVGTVRMGTLFFHAVESGWEEKKGDVKSNKYDVIVEELNKVYGIVMVGGKIKIIREKSNVIDPILGHYDLIGKEDFRTLLQNDVIWTEGKKAPKAISVADVWLGHGGRRTYPNGMALYPDGAPPGWYNTWNGFAVTARPGKCDLLLKHIEEVVCNGVKDDYNWLIDWCADSVQDPANPKGTAIVMRGEEGAGKGTLANTMGQLFGSHYRHLIDDSHLLSNFNAHMIDALFVFADEITWGGNKKTAGKLKGMVTEKYLVGERKGVDAVGYRNMLRMMIASNADWVIPAGPGSRRWFVLDVNDTKTNDRAYFNAIQDELQNGGVEAFLHLLLNRKITADLRRAPHTEALQEQRMRSMASDTIVQWWLFQIETEDLAIIGLGEFEGKWPEWVSKPELYTHYEQWCLTRNLRPQALTVFYKEITKYGPKAGRPNINDKRIHAYSVPSLEVVKVVMTNKIGVKYDG